MDTAVKLKEYHIITVFLLFFILILGVFISDNPMLIMTIFIVVAYLAYKTCNIRKLFTNFIISFPFLLLIILLNVLVSNSGRIVLFRILKHNITLEALISGIILYFKLYVLFSLFIVFDIMVDSDKAVSYFSQKLPKSTLLLMIGFKLIPGLKRRFSDVVNIYELRGINFNKNALKDKLVGYIPVMSVLLEDSLEGSFEIGEAAYVRGFLCDKKTTYDMPKIHKKDAVLITSLICFLSIIITISLLGLLKFDIYNGAGLKNILNYGTASAFSGAMLLVLNFIYS